MRCLHRKDKFHVPIVYSKEQNIWVVGTISTFVYHTIGKKVYTTLAHGILELHSFFWVDFVAKIFHVHTSVGQLLKIHVVINPFMGPSLNTLHAWCQISKYLTKEPSQVWY